jgi:hypothetical protein
MKYMTTLVFMAALVFMLACSGGASNAAENALFIEKCSGCHPAKRGDDKRLDKEGWKKIVDRMQLHSSGMLSDEDADAIIEHLVRIRGPK